MLDIFHLDLLTSVYREQLLGAEPRWELIVWLYGWDPSHYPPIILDLCFFTDWTHGRRNDRKLLSDYPLSPWPLLLSRSVVSDSFVTPWTVACQAPLSKQFYNKEYWSGLPFPPPVDLPDPEIEPKSLASPALADGFFTTVPSGKPI